MNIIEQLLAAASGGNKQNYFMEDFWKGMGQGSPDTGRNGLMYSAMERLNKDNTSGVAPITPRQPPAPQQPAQTYPLLDPNTRVKTLLDFIAAPESSGNYNAVYGNAGASRDLSQMSLNDVIADARARGQQSGSSATGRYQMLSDTMKDVSARLGLTGNEPFTPELQDAMAVELLKRRGLDDYMGGALAPEEFAGNLAKEWAALPKDASGASYYAGDSMGNKAGVGWDAMMSALAPQQAVAGGPPGGAVGAAMQPASGPPGPAPTTPPPQNPEPNFWDRLMMANRAAGGGPTKISSILAATSGTGAGWMPQPEQAGPQGPAMMDPLDLAKLRTEKLRGDELAAKIAASGRGKDVVPTEQAARDYQVQLQRMQEVKSNVLAAHDRVGGRDVGNVYSRATRDMPILGDDTVQADVKTLSKTGIEQMLRDSEYMKGAMTEKEWDILREKVPSPNDPRETWEQFFRDSEAMLEDAARRAGYDPRQGRTSPTTAPSQQSTIPGIPAGVSKYY